MSQDTEKKPVEQTDEPRANENKSQSGGDDAIGRGCAFGCAILLLVMLGLCTRLCTSSDYDSTWDRLDHTVKTDPYFKQWD